jgi:hypothetical protein
MIRLPNLVIERPNKPFESFKYHELPITSEFYREFMKTSERLKFISDKRLGPFQWIDDDEIPEEGN